jgi:hypothetical protein
MVKQGPSKQALGMSPAKIARFDSAEMIRSLHATHPNTQIARLQPVAIGNELTNLHSFSLFTPHGFKLIRAAHRQDITTLVV